MTTSTDRLGWGWFARTRSRGGQQHYRWSIKTGSDAPAQSIQPTAPTVTTISALTAEPIPAALQGVKETPPGPARTSGVESTLYTLNVWLLRSHPETDGDYHLVLGDGQGNTMVAEIPDPTQVDQGGAFAAQIAAARQAFDARHPEMKPLGQIRGGTGRPGLVEINEQVQITGVGFFDFIHGQDGVAGNGIELHPVVAITFS
ncbi:MAG TPA: hypothetical protein VMU89_00115 [Thermomicrobiaceae bacterium]|nr:hypothetical protein [Thermomicrobiaceae bacterium]